MQPGFLPAAIPLKNAEDLFRKTRKYRSFGEQQKEKTHLSRIYGKSNRKKGRR